MLCQLGGETALLLSIALGVGTDRFPQGWPIVDGAESPANLKDLSSIPNPNHGKVGKVKKKEKEKETPHQKVFYT